VWKLDHACLVYLSVVALFLLPGTRLFIHNSSIACNPTRSWRCTYLRRSSPTSISVSSLWLPPPSATTLAPRRYPKN